MNDLSKNRLSSPSWVTLIILTKGTRTTNSAVCTERGLWRTWIWERVVFVCSDSTAVNDDAHRFPHLLTDTHSLTLTISHAHTQGCSHLIIFMQSTLCLVTQTLRDAQMPQTKIVLHCQAAGRWYTLGACVCPLTSPKRFLTQKWIRV